MKCKVITIKFIFSMLSFLFVHSSFSQGKKNKNTFLIEGILTGKNTNAVILTYTDKNGMLVTQSSKIINKKFIFSGTIDEPSFAGLKSDFASDWVEDSNYAPFFIEPAIMKINVEENHFKSMKVLGSKTQNQFDSLEKNKFNIYNQMAQLKIQLATLNDSLGVSLKRKDSVKMIEIMSKRSLIFNELQPYEKKINNVDLKFITNHPNSYLSSFLLNEQFKTNGLDEDSVKVYFNKLSRKIQNSFWGKKIKIWLHEILPINSKVPNINGINLNGKKIATNYLLNKEYTLLIFWASWCGPCRGMAPDYKKLYKKFHYRGLSIIVITFDEYKKDWQKAIKEDSLIALNPIFPEGSNNLSDKFGIYSIPAEILLKQDRVIGKYAGANKDELDINDLEIELNKMFNKEGSFKYH